MSMVTCFGEILWDIYPDHKKIGGAPFNVAAHLNQLGIESSIISRIGKDKLGLDALEIIQNHGVPVYLVQIDNQRQTGVVHVELDSEAKASYRFADDVAWDHIELTNNAIKAVQNSDAFIFGSLACRNSASAKSLYSLLQYSRLNVLDINLRQNFYSKDLFDQLLGQCDILKLNDEELFILSAYYSFDIKNPYTILKEKFDIDMIIVTMGSEGAMVYNGSVLYRAPAPKVEVLDTVGSGDSFLAAFIMNYLQNQPIEECLKKACKLGAYVATKKGAIPKYKKEQIDAL